VNKNFNTNKMLVLRKANRAKLGIILRKAWKRRRQKESTGWIRPGKILLQGNIPGSCWP